MYNNNKEYLRERFEEHVFDKYAQYCKALGQQPSEKGLLSFLIKRDLIPTRAIQQFAVKEEFGKITKFEQFSKTQKINVLAELFDLPQKTVRGILKESGQQE